MVKEGYKQTEIGLIPEDWEVKQLKTALKTNPQYGINAAAVTCQGNLPTYIRITDISEEGHFKPENLVSVEHSSASKYFLEEGDLVFARTGASVGKSYLYRPKDGRLVYAGFLIRVKADKDVLLPGFLSQYVKTKAYWNWVQLMSMRSGQPGINGNEYGQLLLPLPPLPEQRSLAQALSDVDALIAALYKLIAKQRDLKSSTMQQLLTGKKRLPGFGEGQGCKESVIGLIPEDWDALRLGDIAPLQRGFDLPTSQLRRGHYPVVYSNGIINHHSDFMVKAPGVVTGRSGTIGNVHYVSENYWPHNTALWVTEFKCNNPKYIYYLYKSVKLERFGSGSGVPTLNRNDVHDWIVSIPKAEEQRVIATVLSDMDKAITALESRLAKTQAIKSGMMQELLTGRTRLL